MNLEFVWNILSIISTNIGKILTFLGGGAFVTFIAYRYNKKTNQATLLIHFEPEYKNGIQSCSIILENIGKHQADNIKCILKFVSQKNGTTKSSSKKQYETKHLYHTQKFNLEKINISKRGNNFFIIELEYSDKEVNKIITQKNSINFICENDMWKKNNLSLDEIKLVEDMTKHLALETHLSQLNHPNE